MFNPYVGAAVNTVNSLAYWNKFQQIHRWPRGNAELSIGVMRGSLFVRLRRADGVTTQWDFTSEESVKQIRDLCDRFLEVKSHAEK